MKGLIKYRLLRSFATPARRGKLLRFHHNMQGIGASIGKPLEVLRFVTALACITAMILYVGFSPDSIDLRKILRVIHVSQTIFIGDIIINLIFNFRDFWSEKGLFQKLTILLVLSTVIPAIWTSCGASPHVWYHFLHTRLFFFICLAVYSIAELCYGTMGILARRTNPSLILSVSFLIFILIGSFVLMLPKCTTVAHLRYVDSLFMAASAVSMTGMSTINAAETFTTLGWTVIAILMQIGALGVLTFTSFFALFFSGRTSIYNQLLMRDFVYSKNMKNLIPVILYILISTILIEAVGALCIFFTLPENLFSSLNDKVFFAVFHSMSAFCNCGFSTLPDGVATPSLLFGNQLFFVVMTVLIVAGGIGFPNLVNLRDALMEYFRRLKCRLTKQPFIRRIHIYDLNTKLVLIITLIFFVGGALTFYLFEYNNAFESLPLKQKIVQSIFCSASVRTAGFATYGPQSWLGITFLVALFLMWVGCASQSMGGGIKINAFAAVVLNLRSIIYGQKGVTVFGRTIAPSSIRRANAVVTLFVFALFAYSGILMILEPGLSPLAIIFESFSALTTVGMSSAITMQFGDISKIILASAMFLGRVGIISVLCGVVGNRQDKSGMLPSDDIIIN